MPFTLKNKLSGATTTIRAIEYRSGKYPANTWEIIAQEDIVDLFRIHQGTHRIRLGKFDKDEAMDVLKVNPDYYFEEISHSPIDTPSNKINYKSDLLNKDLNRSIPPPSIRRIKAIKIACGISKWIITNIWLFIFYVMVGIAIWYFTTYKPIFK